MRAVIRFLNSEEVKSEEIVHRIQQQYGESCLSHSKIYEWVDCFKNGRISVFMQALTSKTDVNIEAVEQMIRKNRGVKIDEIANKLKYSMAESMQISHGSAFSIIHDLLNF